MKLVTDRISQISPYLRPYMEECFRESCKVIQAEIDSHAGGIWEEFFYLDRHEAAGYYRLEFLQDRYLKDLDLYSTNKKQSHDAVG